MTTQLAVEQAEMIRGKRLRPLAAVGDKPLEIEGYGTIEPLTRTVARLEGPDQLLRHLHSQGRARRGGRHRGEDLGRPHHALEALKKYATSRGALFAPLSGQDAQKAVMPAVQANAWLLHAGGKTKVSPDSVGIPKP